MHIASATPRTGYVARGIAGKEAASCVHSHQTAASDILYGVYFYDHVACGIASGQGGIRIRLTCHAADIDRSLHCGRGTASGDGTAYLSTHHTAALGTKLTLPDTEQFSMVPPQLNPTTPPILPPFI